MLRHMKSSLGRRHWRLQHVQGQNHRSKPLLSVISPWEDKERKRLKELQRMSYLKVAIRIHEQIVRLHVSMQYIGRVDILQGSENLWFEVRERAPFSPSVTIPDTQNI